nr:MAG TPA: hypothetical protein [Bacteriophage sp.]
MSFAISNNCDFAISSSYNSLITVTNTSNISRKLFFRSILFVNSSFRPI